MLAEKLIKVDGSRNSLDVKLEMLRQKFNPNFLEKIKMVT